MALAEGTLDASDVPAAEASIAACDECSRDLELQWQALALLGATPRVGMTELESARMRRSLTDQLGLAAATGAVAVATVRRRRFGWTGALSAAAVLLIVVLAAPTLNLLGGGGDDSATTEDAFAAPSPTSTVAAAETTPAAGGLAAEDGADRATEQEVAEAPGLSADDTTTTVAAAAEFGRLRDGLTLEDIVLAYDLSFLAPDTATLYSSAAAPPETDEFNRCAETGLAELASEGTVVTQWSFTGLREADGRELAIMAYESDTGDVVVMSHDAETCEIVERT
jgi:hypothetical protein